MPNRPGLVCILGTCAAITSAQPWREIESPLLTDHVQLTHADRFYKAGEAYFDPTSSWIIFQAIPAPEEGAEPDEHYSMYIAPLQRDDDGRITGLGTPVLLSPPGSANTCGWFHPTIPGEILFASTIHPPTTEEVPGYQRDKSRYQWAFPPGMEIVRIRVDETGKPVEDLQTVFERPGYTAEGSYSPDGRFILYANVIAEKSTGEKADADIFVYDTKTGRHHALVQAPGYDGGPFFTPDGRAICYRSDRAGNDLLQLFVAELAFDDEGVPVAIEAEYPLTDNHWVNWAPFFHPSGRFLVFTGSGPYHEYDVYAIELDPKDHYAKPPHERIVRRVTFTGGFDGLPVFNADGTLMMWTSQRTAEGEGRERSQLWVARVHPDALDPTVWTGPLTEQQAVQVARTALGEDPNRMMGVARREGMNWIYEARILSGQNPGVVRVLVRPDASTTILTDDAGS